MMNFVVRNHNGFPVPFAFRRTPARSTFDQLFDTAFDDLFQAQRNKSATDTVNTITPRIGVTENEHSYVVEAEIPGVAKENVKISIEGKQVSLEAEVKREVEEKDGENVVRVERTARKFARRFVLAKEVDDTQVVAKLENGILTLTLPKKVEARAKQIVVQ